MTKEQMLELCSSIKRLNLIREKVNPSVPECCEGIRLKERIDELWAVYCGEVV